MDRKERAVPALTSASAQSVVYASSSPDELALVDAAKRCGIVLIKRERTAVTLHLTTKTAGGAGGSGSASAFTESYTVLHTLEFSSDRKRMSVVTSHSDPKTGATVYTLWCKGADDKILERLTPGADTNQRVAYFRPVLDRYARHGLRTLCYAMKVLDEKWYTEWAETLRVANTTVSGAAGADGLTAREVAVNKCYEAIESGGGLQLIGVSGIEDRLQDGVGETITQLRRAGIKVWMLTGDKYQTAVEISRSCGLIDNPSAVVQAQHQPQLQLSIIGTDRDSVWSQLQAHLDTTAGLSFGRGRGSGYAVVIDGVSLAICLQHFAPQFADLTYVIPTGEQFRSEPNVLVVVSCCVLSRVCRTDRMRFRSFAVELHHHKKQMSCSS